MILWNAINKIISVIDFSFILTSSLANKSSTTSKLSLLNAKNIGVS